MFCAVLCQEGGPGGAQADDAARVRTSRHVASGGPHGPPLFCRVVIRRSNIVSSKPAGEVLQALGARPGAVRTEAAAGCPQEKGSESNNLSPRS